MGEGQQVLWWTLPEIQHNKQREKDRQHRKKEREKDRQYREKDNNYKEIDSCAMYTIHYTTYPYSMCTLHKD